MKAIILAAEWRLYPLPQVARRQLPVYDKPMSRPLRRFRATLFNKEHPGRVLDAMLPKQRDKSLHA